MTARDFTNYRHQLGWTKKRLGEWLNRTPETIRKYETHGIDGAEAIAVQALASGWRP